MNDLDRKMLKYYPGKTVRKDLTALMKKGANVPTYVLEYLLGMYCCSDDEETTQKGFEQIRKILSENYVRPDQSELIKSKIIQAGEYTIIDKISVRFLESLDRYVASFTNFKIHDFFIDPSIVVHNEKLLLGGIWCIIKISYSSRDEEEDEEEDAFDIFGDRKYKKKKKEKKTIYDSPFSVVSLKPIQMSSLNLEEFIAQRKNFTKDEWIDVLLKSTGYNPDILTFKQKLHYILRLVPFAQKNYNLVELGPRGTGKSHVYSEISPYSILMSAGHTTVANLFYHMGSKSVGLVGHWDCIAFDEVGGLGNKDFDVIQTMKNYMANGSFARGTESVNADASIALEGNTFYSVYDMLKTATLFDPFPELYKNDSAFFDRIHAYLPGWETPKLKSNSLTDGYGLISDCISEFCHMMRPYDFTDKYLEYFELNHAFNKRDDIAVSKTFSGLTKLIYPDGEMTKEEAKEILTYSIECRRRVKEQLNKMTPTEFKDVDLGFIDNETNIETIVNVPEQPKESLVPNNLLSPGYAYGIGKSLNNVIGVYRLEYTKSDGTGQFKSKDIEGVSFSSKIKASLNAAFNYFTNHINEITNVSYDKFDYALYFNDLQKKSVSTEVTVAEVVALASVACSIPVLPSTAIIGRVVMSGSMMPLSTNIVDLITAAHSAGAKNILLPYDCRADFAKVPYDLQKDIVTYFYQTPIHACKIALGLEKQNE